MKITKKSLMGIDPFLLGGIAILLILILAGLYSAYRILVSTEDLVLIWGMLVPSYAFFALAATGVSLVNSIFTVFNVERFRPIIKRGIWLSLILIIPFGISILMDLGRPAHIFNLYIFFNTTSRMAWMGALYLTFVLSLVLQLLVVFGKVRVPRWIPLILGIILFAVTLLIQSNLGAVFGGVTAKPLWDFQLLPLRFIVLAVTLGVCFHILFISITYRVKNGSIPEALRKLFPRDYRPMIIGLIIANIALMAARYISGMLSPEASPYVKILLSGQYSLPLWVMEVLLGGVLPVVILFLHRTRGSMSWLIGASALVATGVYFSLYDLLITGQSIGPVLDNNFIPYFPDVWEMLLVVGAVAICLLVYTLGELLLPLEPEEKAAWFIFRGLRKPQISKSSS